MDEEEDQVYRSNDSVLAPIFVQMMKNSVRNGTTDMDSQLQDILKRRERRPVSNKQLLQGMRIGLTLAPADDDINNARDDGAGEREKERGRMIFTYRVNQMVAVPSSAVSVTDPPPVDGSEYFIGPEFEALLEHLTETDPNRYGTPPARRDAVEAPDDMFFMSPGEQCLVCLDDIQIMTFGKQMPCGHSFHSYCLFYWLDVHSSCPVCRCQLRTAKDEPDGGGGFTSSSSSNKGYEITDPEEEGPMAA